jgi:hypothetical protein
MTADATDVHYLVIVSRERPDIYDEMARRFAEDPTVRVILDRRVVERYQSEGDRQDDRSPGERRTTAMQVTASLWLAGYVIVRLR